MTISLRPLNPGFVAEIRDIDLRQPQPAEIVDELVAALDRYAVLIYPDQDIIDDHQLAFGRYFGPLESATFIHLKDRDHTRRHQQINYVSNLDPEGRMLPQDDRVRMYQLANRLWHTDSSFKAIPGRYSLLHGRVVPPEGGETEFADLRAAYDELSEAVKAKLEGLLAPHSLMHSNRQLGLPDFSVEEQAEMPPALRPLVHRHPGSGRKTLYLASHAMHIHSWSVPEGRVLLNDLIEFATQPRFVHRHVWRRGDLVTWDNRCTMHRVRAYDDTKYRRELHRVMVQDTGDSLRAAATITPAASEAHP